MLCHEERPRLPLCAQMLDFLHPLLRLIVSQESLLEESGWDSLLGFELIDAQILSVSQFIEKTEIRTKAMKAAKGRINAERSKKSKTDVTASDVLGIYSILMSTKGEHTFVRYVLNFWPPDIQVRFSGGVGAFWLFCAIYVAKRTSYGLICPVFKVSVFVVGWPKNWKIYIWMITLNFLITCCLYIWVSCTLALKLKIWSRSCHRVQNCLNENIHRFQFVLFLFEAHSIRAVKCIIGFRWSK